jgi:hypothetical protein
LYKGPLLEPVKNKSMRKKCPKIKIEIIITIRAKTIIITDT